MRCRCKYACSASARRTGAWHARQPGHLPTKRRQSPDTAERDRTTARQRIAPHDAARNDRVCSSGRWRRGHRSRFIRVTTHQRARTAWPNRRWRNTWRRRWRQPVSSASGRDGRQPERPVVQPEPDRLDPLDAYAARGKRRVRGQRGCRVDRAARGMRGQLRPRQPAPDQRAVRLPPQSSAGARDRRAHSVDRNRAGYFQETHPRELFRECSHFAGS